MTGWALGPTRPATALALVLLAAGPARAGHEMPVYPSYYPQEITVESLAPAAAGPRLAKGTLHAYLGADPFAGKPLPADVHAVESLASYVVLTVSPAVGSAETRCRLARHAAARLAPAPGQWRAHPYPVTPHHPDYLQHIDRARAAAETISRRGGGEPPPLVRVQGRGALGRRLAGAEPPGGDPAQVTVEEVSLRELLEPHRIAIDGWTGPPWWKEGWYHAHLLQAPAMADRGAREAAAAMAERLMRSVLAPAERLDLERALVSRLGAGCERMVAGYVLRREAMNGAYSGGVENVGWDSQAGLASAIFVRTVKLKDFPWNGWLTIGLPERPSAAWNPIAGFTDPAGQVLWAALGDPALLPEPQGGRWIDNRVRPERSAEPATRAALAVPRDALLPEAGTGRLREVGEGRTARARVTYRVLASAFHDGTRTTPADLLAAYAFAFKWGGGHPGEPGHDPEVARATALLRESLAGVRVLRVDQDRLRFGDIQMSYEVPVVEVYLTVDGPELSQLAALAPPWSTVPWPVLALMDEAVRRGWATLSAGEARRRGRPWLDLVRDAPLGRRLGGLADELAGRAHVPEGLGGLVTPAESRARWAALRRFAADHRHWLVTNGPYQMRAWTPGRTVLRVVRDYSLPLGVGSFDAYPIPRRGRVARTEARDRTLTVWAEVERVERFGREHQISVGPLGRDWPERDRAALPTCRFVLLGADGSVMATGALPPGEAGTFVIPLDVPRGPAHTALVAVVVRDNAIDADARVIHLAP